MFFVPGLILVAILPFTLPLPLQRFGPVCKFVNEDTFSPFGLFVILSVCFDEWFYNWFWMKLIFKCSNLYLKSKPAIKFSVNFSKQRQNYFLLLIVKLRVWGKVNFIWQWPNIYIFCKINSRYFHHETKFTPKLWIYWIGARNWNLRWTSFYFYFIFWFQDAWGDWIEEHRVLVRHCACADWFIGWWHAGGCSPSSTVRNWLVSRHSWENCGSGECFVLNGNCICCFVTKLVMSVVVVVQVILGFDRVLVWLLDFLWFLVCQCYVDLFWNSCNWMAIWELSFILDFSLVGIDVS